ncbi:glycosyltransferase [Bacillus sp. JJ1521]|uniref:glycosyltransferase n=1 Tax=Bacillus sp. JJ1521 TaxID=3122957 RepID=UPI002FFF70CC
MPLLSIIIPVYNVENYIDECLQSILKQEFRDYEIILVDNASTDRSGEICKVYAQKYPNIKLIKLESNALPAGARNAGFEIAAGEYIHFCDSDDYYVDSSFSRIANELIKLSPSVLFGQFICIPERGAFITSDIPLDETFFLNANSNEVAKYLVSLPNLLCTPWRFIVKRQLLLENDIKFPEGYHSEDEEWFPKVICCAENFALLSNPFYYYRPRAIGSVTSSKTYLNSKSHLVVALHLLKFARGKKYTDARRELLIRRANFLLGLFATRCDTYTTEQIKELAKILNAYSDLLASDIAKSLKNELFDYIESFGVFEGLLQYQSLVKESTLRLVEGKQNKDVYVFPTGYNGEGTARIIQNAGYKVKGFIDNSKQKSGSIINGIPVCLPNCLIELYPVTLEDVFIIVASQRKQVVDSIVKQIREMGIEDSQFAIRIYE